MANSFDEYLSKSDWRVKENANCTFSFGGLNRYVVGKETAKCWKKIYDKINPGIIAGHDSGDFHIHDLGSFSSYCFGGSLYNLLEKGIKGISNIAVSRPAKHLESICSQIANITTIFQNENAGAIALCPRRCLRPNRRPGFEDRSPRFCVACAQ